MYTKIGYPTFRHEFYIRPTPHRTPIPSFRRKPESRGARCGAHPLGLDRRGQIPLLQEGARGRPAARPALYPDTGTKEPTLPFLRQQKGDAERSERRGFTHSLPNHSPSLKSQNHSSKLASPQHMLYNNNYALIRVHSERRTEKKNRRVAKGKRNLSKTLQKIE